MIYEIVVRYENYNSTEMSGTDHTFFQAESDDHVKAYAENMGPIHQRYAHYSSYFVRVTRIDDFCKINEDGTVTGQKKETHIFRRAWPVEVD